MMSGKRWTMMKSCTWPAIWSSGAKEVKTKRRLFIRLSLSTAPSYRYENMERWRLNECTLAKKHLLTVFKQCYEVGLFWEIEKDEIV